MCSAFATVFISLMAMPPAGPICGAGKPLNTTPDGAMAKAAPDGADVAAAVDILTALKLSAWILMLTNKC